MGHLLHHQGLALDEEMIHEERVQDRRAREERSARVADVYAACVGRFYEDLAERLVDGARGSSRQAGAELEVHDVPGAFELPLAAKYCAESGRYAGVACLGAVIRGETSHYDYVCGEAARGIARVVAATPACRAPSAC